MCAPALPRRRPLSLSLCLTRARAACWPFRPQNPPASDCTICTRTTFHALNPPPKPSPPSPQPLRSTRAAPLAPLDCTLATPPPPASHHPPTIALKGRLGVALRLPQPNCTPTPHPTEPLRPAAAPSWACARVRGPLPLSLSLSLPHTHIQLPFLSGAACQPPQRPRATAGAPHFFSLPPQKKALLADTDSFVVVAIHTPPPPKSPTIGATFRLYPLDAPTAAHARSP